MRGAPLVAVLLLLLTASCLAEPAEDEDEGEEAEPVSFGPCRVTQDCMQAELDDPHCHPRAVYPNESYPQPVRGSALALAVAG